MSDKQKEIQASMTSSKQGFETLPRELDSKPLGAVVTADLSTTNTVYFISITSCDVVLWSEPFPASSNSFYIFFQPLFLSPILHGFLHVLHQDDGLMLGEWGKTCHVVNLANGIWLFFIEKVHPILPMTEKSDKQFSMLKICCNSFFSHGRT